jgi:hypothetical protein
LGKPWGVGKLEWGGDEEGEVSLQATWDQGGRGRKEEGFQVSKRDSGKGELSRDQQGGLARGTTRGMARGIHEGLRHDLVLSTCIYVS